LLAFDTHDNRVMAFFKAVAKVCISSFVV
jgi:hypothetical protein